MWSYLFLKIVNASGNLASGPRYEYFDKIELNLIE